MSNNRNKLEKAALEIVQRNGMNELSFRTLADEIGIKSSSVHYHFPEKANLAQSLIERYSKQFFLTLKEIESQRWGLKRKIKAFIDIFESVAKQDKLCLCGMMASEVEQLNEANRQLLREYFVGTEEWLTRLFDDCRDELLVDLCSNTMAKCLLAGLEGALLLDRVASDNRHLKAQKLQVMSFIV